MRIAITYTALFIVRRAIFAFSCIFLADFLWGQLALQTSSSLLMASYVLVYSPLKTTLANRMEVMNECTMLGLVYGLFSFSQSIPDPNYRTTGGLYYIGMIVNNIIVHIYFIASSMFQ